MIFKHDFLHLEQIEVSFRRPALCVTYKCTTFNKQISQDSCPVITHKAQSINQSMSTSIFQMN